MSTSPTHATYIYNHDLIPEELKQFPQWIHWRGEWDEKSGKLNKIPQQAILGGNAKVNDPSSWCDYETAVKEQRESPLPFGLGFVLTEEDDIIGFDFDHCIDENGKIADWVQNDFISVLRSYSEVSPSGKGVRIFVRGFLPGPSKKTQQIEVYDKGRYLTVTGNHIEGTPTSVEHRQNEIEAIYQRYFGPIEKAKKAKNQVMHSSHPVLANYGNGLSDNQVLYLARSAQNRDKFNALWSGEWDSIGYPSPSEADQALCSMLAYWTAKNAEQIDRLFRKSGLMRDKWDENRGEHTYGELTLIKAIGVTLETYDPAHLLGTDHDNAIKMNHIDVAKHILTNYQCYYYQNHLYIYSNGVYRVGDYLIEKQAHNLLGKHATSRNVSEVIAWIQRETRIDDLAMNPDDGLINVQNGLLNWRTGELLPHTPERLSTVQIPVIYDPAAKCGTVDIFLNSVLPQDLIPVYYEMLGYCLVPHARYEKAFLFVGEGFNGKTTALSIPQALVGSENVANMSLHQVEGRFGAQNLRDKMLCVDDDLPGRKLEETSIFKKIVSGQSLTVEEKGKPHFNIKPTVKLLFAANHLPESADNSNGFWRRWIVFPLSNVFGTNPDRELGMKLTSPAMLSGVLNKAIEGLRRLESQNGFSYADSDKSGLEAWRYENDNVRQFVDECCEMAGYQSKVEIHRQYMVWVAESGQTPVGRNKFYSRIKTISGVEDRKDANGIHCFYGIQLNPSANF
ncbi:MAG: phage/plasmid primase, P4 family [Solirubrobacterales bacterium]